MIKKMTVWVMVIIFALTMSMITGCGNSKIIDGVRYETYGLLNKNAVKSNSIEYRAIFGNIMWSFFLFETIIMPLYFVGYSLYEPVKKKRSDGR